MTSTYQPKLSNSIPIYAMTTNYAEFCRIIIEKLNDFQHYIQSILTKMEKEHNILITVNDLNDRERNVIETYLKKLGLDLTDAIKVRDELQKLVSSKKSMRKAFTKKQIKIE